MLLSDRELTFYHQTLGVPYVLVFQEFFEASFLSFNVITELKRAMYF